MSTIKVKFEANLLKTNLTSTSKQQIDVENQPLKMSSESNANEPKIPIRKYDGSHRQQEHT